MGASEDRINHFLEHGWVIFDHDPLVKDWTNFGLSASRTAVTAPENQRWLRHDGTWFVGVNALHNDCSGRLPGGPPLDGSFRSVVESLIPDALYKWDRGQVSVCYPGYPGFSGDEPEAAHRYRLRRDAAHIDGLNRVGPERRRFLLEQHAFILGLPMVPFSPGASPFVVWDRSHHVAKQAFMDFYDRKPAAVWRTMDITPVYQNLRKSIFAQCTRIEIHAEPGQCFLAHRHSLHGMAAWSASASAGPDGRMICYFRPPLHDPETWLTLP